ncbi:acyltransferase [Hominifimenecus microfluidus]|uniref:acyltransferase n=1 Tax=Hominifimenecus microfluidus TaxID=2885348 RepID=UPI0027E55D03|nr:acyltransferase [Hominifimenecus microfluidus]
MNELQKCRWRKKVMKARYMAICLLGFDRIKYLKKHHIFAKLGDNVLFQPTRLPNEPKLIKIHNNVKIASDVIFCTHDVINAIISEIEGGTSYQTHGGCIEIHDNVFVGGRSIILENVSIGPNAVIGAGSVVTRDVPENTVVAGNPARVIGSFTKLQEKRRALEAGTSGWDPDFRDTELWALFYADRQREK